MAQAKKTTRDTDDLMREVEALREDFGALTRELKILASERSDSIKSKTADRVVALKAASERRLEDASEKTTKAVQEASDYAKAHPAATVAASAILGFVVGALTARR